MNIIEPGSTIFLPEIHSLGMTAFDSIYSEKAHSSKWCELLRIARGEMTLYIEDKPFKGKAGDIFFVPSNVMHRDEFDMNEGLEIFYCSFYWKNDKWFFNHVDNSKLKKLSEKTLSSINTMYDILRTDTGKGTEIDRMISSSRLLSILLTIFRDVVKSGKNADKDPDYSTTRREKILDDARSYIKRNYDEPISLDELAANLKISTYYLSHIFSEEGEFSYSTYLTNVRMEKAREFLHDSRMNISEVAYKVGFESANYFTKVFKKTTGMSPKQYIASVAGKKKK